MALVAHHRITNAPPKKARKSGMGAAEAAEHYAKAQAIKRAQAKRKRGAE